MTATDIRALAFGYLNGGDLLDFCHEQILIKTEINNPGTLYRHVLTAYGEITGALSSKYDIVTEYKKTPPVAPANETRVYQVIKLTTIAAIRNICAKLTDVPKQTADNSIWLDRTLLALRNGQTSIPELTIQPLTDAVSESVLVQNSFKTLG